MCIIVAADHHQPVGRRRKARQRSGHDPGFAPRRGPQAQPGFRAFRDQQRLDILVNNAGMPRQPHGRAVHCPACRLELLAVGSP